MSMTNKDFRARARIGHFARQGGARFGLFGFGGGQRGLGLAGKRVGASPGGRENTY